MDKATCRVLSEPEDSVYLSADEEWDYVSAEANINLAADGTILDEQVIARYKGENVMASREDVKTTIQCVPLWVLTCNVKPYHY